MPSFCFLRMLRNLQNIISTFGVLGHGDPWLSSVWSKFWLFLWVCAGFPLHDFACFLGQLFVLRKLALKTCSRAVCFSICCISIQSISADRHPKCVGFEWCILLPLEPVECWIQAKCCLFSSVTSLHWCSELQQNRLKNKLVCPGSWISHYPLGELPALPPWSTPETNNDPSASLSTSKAELLFVGKVRKLNCSPWFSGFPIRLSVRSSSW